MFIVKVLMVYAIIEVFAVIRAITLKKILGADTFVEADQRFRLIMAILFAAIIIREGLW